MTKNDTFAAETLKNDLLPGEEIRWYGTPSPFRLLEKDSAKVILGKWIGGVATMALIVGFCIKSGWSMLSMAVMLVMVLAFMLTPLLEKNRLQNYQYWITDKRVIIMNQRGDTCALDQRYIDDCMIITGQTSGACLVLCSDIFKEAPKQLRWQACHPKNTQAAAGTDNPGMGMVLYALENAHEAANQLQCIRRN